MTDNPLTNPGNPFDGLLEHYQQVYEALDEEQKIAAAASIIPKLLDHAREGGSFRYLIYDRLGLSAAAYVPLCLAGVLDASNDLVSTAIGSDEAVTEALKMIETHAQSQPMQGCGVFRDDGSEIQMPGPERTAWFRVLYALQEMHEKAMLQNEVNQRLKDELLQASLAEAKRD